MGRAGAVGDFLIDKSAIVLFARQRAVRRVWQDKIDAGVIGMCTLTELEMHYSAKSVEDSRDMTQTLTGMFPFVPMDETCWDRAREIQDGLLSRGTHRSAGPVDLLIAATAERRGLIVLHRDKDFDCIAEVTGQAAVRVDRAAV